MPVKHSFTSPKSDGGDATLVRPSDWNADHTDYGNWTDYTPTVTASTTNPTIASRLGRYKQLDSKTYALQIQINFVTGDNAGSGVWAISLPAGLTAAGLDQQLAGRLHDAGSRYYVCTGTVATGGTTVNQIVHTETGSNGQVAHNAPFTWADGDQLFLTGIIEVA